MLKKFFKIFLINFLIWILGTIVISWCWYNYWLNNPVQILPDGTMPGDSIAIPFYGDSMALICLLVILNSLYFIFKIWRSPKILVEPVKS